MRYILLPISYLKRPSLVFALVTTSGSLIAYNMNLKARALVKMTAHSGDATTLDWHPTRPYVVATGGAGDRCVKIWDLESYLNFNKDENNMNVNQSTWTSRGESVGTEDSGDAESSRSVWTLLNLCCLFQPVSNWFFLVSLQPFCNIRTSISVCVADHFVDIIQQHECFAAQGQPQSNAPRSFHFGFSYSAKMETPCQ